jgi:uncharacterized integral membrane protein (TIGR00698 family)
VKKLMQLSPGLLYAAIIAIASIYLGKLVPLLGAPLFGILLGALVGNLVGMPARVEAGARFTSKRVLQWSIILIGSSLSLRQVFAVGSSSFAVMIGTLAVAFGAALLIGKGLGIPARMTVLIGAGTGICGGSAIAAVSPIIEAEEVEIAYAMSTIFLFNVVAVLLFPAIGHLFGFSSTAFGLWAGTAINDTSSVVAAGYAYSNAAGDYATIVKLTRTTMIVPISLMLAGFMAIRLRRNLPVSDRAPGNVEAPKPAARTLLRVFPWFILGFLATSLVNTLHLLPVSALSAAAAAGRFLIVMALAAVGLNANLRKMVQAGFRPILLGLGVWASVAVSSLAIQRLVG